MAQKNSKKLSYIGSNIKKIRQVKKISQADFAKLFELARPSVGAYEEGRSEPKLETILSIAHYFRISIDVLLTKDLTVSEIFSMDRLNEKLDQVHDKESKEVKKDSKPEIQVVEIKDFLDYIVSHKNTDFLNSLKRMHVPVDLDGELRCFQMRGSEMEYHQQGLHHGDLLICKRKEKDNLPNLLDELVILITKDHITARRLNAIKDNTVILVSDDPHYEDLNISIEDTLEIWHIKTVISNYLKKPSILEERVLQLENEMRKLKAK